jgi:hypothetical protein
MGGASIANLGFHLCWHVWSMSTYLPECFQDIGGIIKQAIQGVFKMY